MAAASPGTAARILVTRVTLRSGVLRARPNFVRPTGHRAGTDSRPRGSPRHGRASAAAAGVEEGVPVVALVGIDVAGAGLPLGVAVAAQADVSERVVHVVGDAGVLAEVQLVAVPVRVRAAGVAGL